MTPLLRIIELWRGEAPALLCGIAMALLSTAVLAGLALAAGAAPLAAALGSGVAGLMLLRGLGVSRVVLRYVERLVTHRATFRALTTLRLWMFRRLVARSAGGLGLLRRGDALARLVGDVDALDGLYLRILVPFASTLLLLVAAGLILGGSAPVIAFAVCLLLGISAVLIPFRAALAARAGGARLAEMGAGLRVATVDALGGIREIRAFGNEGRALATVQAREAALFAAQRDVARTASLAQAGSVLCGQAAMLLVVVGGLPAVLSLPALLLTVAASEAGAAMARAGALAGHAAAAAARVLEAGDAAGPAVAEPVTPLQLTRRTSLRFEGVRFAWPGRPGLFDGLTLDIAAGSRVAILGPSGAGKSTLAALALKVVAPQAGRILLGGVDVARLRTDEVRGQIAWLSQATHVFADTIRANLLLGRPDADEPALWRALTQAGLADVVEGLPDGLDAWLGEGGSGLSGGQLRRVALARALLSTAPILILDEPATGLDAAAERAFFTTLNETTLSETALTETALTETAAGRTIILIVHRLTGVERLDRIWRLSGGRAIAATG